METKKIKVLVEQKTTSTGKKFNVYKTVTKNGRLMELKFRKEVTNLPTENCYAIVEVNNMNVDSNRQYPCLWVKGVVSYQSIDEVVSATNVQKINDLFD